MKKIFSVTSTGDSLFVAPFPKEYEQLNKELQKELEKMKMKQNGL